MRHMPVFEASIFMVEKCALDGAVGMDVSGDWTGMS